MKTKTRRQSKTLIAFAAILCCMISVNSFAQSSIVPTLQDFHGTWVGVNADGRPVEITLTSDWKCIFNTANNAPMFSDNPVAAYRMPQFDPKVLTDVGPPASPEITIKFYTQNAMAGIRVPATNSSTSVGDNSLTTNMVEQIYTGLAVLSFNASGGQMEMTLYLDAVNFRAAPSVITPTPDDIPYCVLVKQ